MAEDFRVTVSLDDEGEAARALRALHDRRAEDDVRRRLGGRLAVSGENGQLFVYADSEEAATEAARTAAEALAQDGLRATSVVERWHHEEEEWEPLDDPDPTAAAQHEAEHERLEQEETAESQATGLAEWELRIEFASHRDARDFEHRLEHEGFSHLVRRWRYLLVGTNDHDDAQAWAQRLESELPAGAAIHVEPGSGLAWEFVPERPFAVFGGLGG